MIVDINDAHIYIKLSMIVDINGAHIYIKLISGAHICKTQSRCIDVLDICKHIYKHSIQFNKS